MAFRDSRFGLEGGVSLEPRNPYPFVKVILTEKGTNFTILYKNRPIFYNFRVLEKNFEILEKGTHI